MKKLSKTRFAILPDNRRLILGVDKDNLFEEGAVYECRKILDEIIFTNIGKYALTKNGENGRFPNENSDANSQIYCAEHLLTLKEWNNFNKQKENKDEDTLINN